MAKAVREQCDQEWGEEFYFPVASVDDLSDIRDETLSHEYSRFLKATSGPSLSCGESITEAYRFLWLPSYRPAAVILVRRIDSHHWTVDAFEFVHPRHGSPETVARHRRLDISDARARELTATLSRAGFWTEPMMKNSGADDGQIWVIEGRLNRGYRVVSRINAASEAFKQAGRSFFALGGIPVPPEANQ